MLTAISLLQSQSKDATETLASTIGDIKPTDWSKDPGGKALTLAGAYAHLVFSEDSIIQGMLQQKPSLSESTFKNHTGASEVMPAMDDKWSENHARWYKTVTLDLPQFQKYAAAVFAATKSYLENLKVTDLDRQIDLGSMGTYTVAHILSNWVIGHTHNLTGEISAAKGIFGAKVISSNLTQTRTGLPAPGWLVCKMV